MEVDDGNFLGLNPNDFGSPCASLIGNGRIENSNFPTFRIMILKKLMEKEIQIIGKGID